MGEGGILSCQAHIQIFVGYDCRQGGDEAGYVPSVLTVSTVPPSPSLSKYHAWTTQLDGNQSVWLLAQNVLTDTMGYDEEETDETHLSSLPLLPSS